jgi:putative protease
MAELLAPAGNLERLKWAVEYGADEIYFGIENFSLRSFAGNFSMDDAREGLEYLHKKGRKGFVTLNIYPFSNEFDDLIDAAVKLQELGADAFIIADLGFLRELRKHNISTELHISTQANTVNYQTILMYADLGIKRVNLARELSFQQIKEIQENIQNSGIETEVFIHGSVCFSYSGRCAISDYLTGRKANRGECTHPCRWGYSLVEEKRPNEYIPVMEDKRGLYLFNTKDLALYDYVEDLINLGVTSFKVEGRMKNAHYLASVLPVYRSIIDGNSMSEDEIQMRISRVDNRGFSKGFMKGSITADDYEIDSCKYKSTSTWIASTTENEYDGYRICKVKNTIYAGEELELLTSDGKISKYCCPNPLKTIDGRAVDHANNQDTILLDKNIPSFSIIRRINS